MLVYRNTAHISGLQLEVVPVDAAHGFQYLDALVSNLRPYAITAQYGDFEFHCFTPYRQQDSDVNYTGRPDTLLRKPGTVYRGRVLPAKPGSLSGS